MYMYYVFVNCIVVGGWQKWSPWSGCSITCGGGQQSRNRSCDSPRPSNSGISCTGITEETHACNTGHCPGKSEKFGDSVAQRERERESRNLPVWSTPCIPVQYKKFQANSMVRGSALG